MHWLGWLCYGIGSRPCDKCISQWIRRQRKSSTLSGVGNIPAPILCPYLPARPHAPKHSTTFQNSATSEGPTVQTQELMGDLFYLRDNTTEIECVPPGKWSFTWKYFTSSWSHVASQTDPSVKQYLRGQEGVSFHLERSKDVRERRNVCHSQLKSCHVPMHSNTHMLMDRFKIPWWLVMSLFLLTKQNQLTFLTFKIENDCCVYNAHETYKPSGLRWCTHLNTSTSLK